MLKGIGFFINTRMFIGKMLWEMYFMKLSNNHRHGDDDHCKGFNKKLKTLSSNIQDINFSYVDKFSHIKTYFCMSCCCKFKQHP